MDGLRSKTTVTKDPDGAIRLKIEWLVVIDNQLQEVQATEEFRIMPEQFGASYISRAVFPEENCGQFLEGTFWVDKQGRRHFYMSAKSGNMGLLGQEANMLR